MLIDTSVYGRKIVTGTILDRVKTEGVLNLLSGPVQIEEGIVGTIIGYHLIQHHAPQFVIQPDGGGEWFYLLEGEFSFAKQLTAEEA